MDARMDALDAWMEEVDEWMNEMDEWVIFHRTFSSIGDCSWSNIRFVMFTFDPLPRVALTRDDMIRSRAFAMLLRLIVEKPSNIPRYRINSTDLLNNLGGSNCFTSFGRELILLSSRRSGWFNVRDWSSEGWNQTNIQHFCILFRSMRMTCRRDCKMARGLVEVEGKATWSRAWSLTVIGFLGGRREWPGEFRSRSVRWLRRPSCPSELSRSEFEKSGLGLPTW